MAPTITGKGYWVVMSNGGVFALGDAQHVGDVKGTGRRPVAILAAPSGRGYQILSSDGVVTSLGQVANFGGVPGRQAVALAPALA